MKVLIILITMMMWSSSVYGLFGKPGWNNEYRRFSESFVVKAQTGFFFLKYPVMSWEQLQFRRDAISKAIDELPSSIYYGRTHLLLYSIMENTVAIHSGLPRAVQGVKSSDYPQSSWMLTDDSQEDVGISCDQYCDLVNSFVPEEIWELYVNWGDEVSNELYNVLEEYHSGLISFLSMLEEEFIQGEAVLRVVDSFVRDISLGGGYVFFTEKIDMPVLVAKDEDSSDATNEERNTIATRYIERWPPNKKNLPGMFQKDGFFSYISLWGDIARELKELEKIKPEDM